MYVTQLTTTNSKVSLLPVSAFYYALAARVRPPEVQTRLYFERLAQTQQLVVQHLVVV